MGADGGSIPRRAEMVKIKGKPEALDDSEILKTQWTCCYISKKPLEKPIVACQLGRLYNKESVVMYLMNKRETEEPLATELAHIKSLKSLINCNMTGSKTSTESSYFLCPVTGREMNGKSKFFVTKICGCVLSEQALNQFPDAKYCLVCERKDFDKRRDLIQLYPKVVELEKLRSATNHKKRTVGDSSVVAPSANLLLLEELKSSTSEISTLKRSKVTESLYYNKKS